MILMDDIKWHYNGDIPTDKSYILVEFRRCLPGCDDIILYAAGKYNEGDEDHYRCLWVIDGDFITMNKNDFYESVKRWAYICKTPVWY